MTRTFSPPSRPPAPVVLPASRVHVRPAMSGDFPVRIETVARTPDLAAHLRREREHVRSLLAADGAVL